jgi:hypothetical protein
MPGHNGGFNPYRDASGRFAEGPGGSGARPTPARSLGKTKAKGTGRGFARAAAGPAAGYRASKPRSALAPRDRSEAKNLVSRMRIQSKQRLGKLDTDAALLKGMREAHGNAALKMHPYERELLGRLIGQMGG